VKKKKIKRWLVFLALAVVVGSMALNLLAYRHAYAMMHFTTGKPRTKEPEKLTLGEKAKVLLRGSAYHALEPVPHRLTSHPKRQASGWIVPMASSWEHGSAPSE